jgi:hypothetical protein
MGTVYLGIRDDDLLALTGRGDAYAAFARRPPAASQLGDLSSAVRDHTEGVARLETLRAQGAIAGSDLDTLNAGKGELATLTKELALRQSR